MPLFKFSLASNARFSAFEIDAEFGAPLCSADGEVVFTLPSLAASMPAGCAVEFGTVSVFGQQQNCADGSVLFSPASIDSGAAQWNTVDGSISFSPFAVFAAGPIGGAVSFGVLGVAGSADQENTMAGSVLFGAASIVAGSGADGEVVFRQVFSEGTAATPNAADGVVLFGATASSAGSAGEGRVSFGRHSVSGTATQQQSAHGAVTFSQMILSCETSPANGIAGSVCFGVTSTIGRMGKQNAAGSTGDMALTYSRSRRLI